MCDDIICEVLHLTSGARIDDVKCDNLTYDYLNPDVFENVVFGMMI